MARRHRKRVGMESDGRQPTGFWDGGELVATAGGRGGAVPVGDRFAAWIRRERGGPRVWGAGAVLVRAPRGAGQGDRPAAVPAAARDRQMADRPVPGPVPYDPLPRRSCGAAERQPFFPAALPSRLLSSVSRAGSSGRGWERARDSLRSGAVRLRPDPGAEQSAAGRRVRRLSGPLCIRGRRRPARAADVPRRQLLQGGRARHALRHLGPRPCPRDRSRAARGVSIIHGFLGV